MNVGWGTYLILFICTVVAMHTWHFREKEPGIDDAGGYGSMYIYAAPFLGMICLATLLLLGLDCFFFVFRPQPSPQPGILAAVYPVLIVATFVSTLRWHYGSWRFGSHEGHRRTDAATVAWLGVSVVGGIAVLVTGLMCMLGGAAG